MVVLVGVEFPKAALNLAKLLEMIVNLALNIRMQIFVNGLKCL